MADTFRWRLCSAACIQLMVKRLPCKHGVQHHHPLCHALIATRPTELARLQALTDASHTRSPLWFAMRDIKAAARLCKQGQMWTRTACSCRTLGRSSLAQTATLTATWCPAWLAFQVRSIPSPETEMQCLLVATGMWA